MGIVSAIARVRAGAKTAGLDGALASLGAELKSDAIPAPLRDVAGRLAALIATKTQAPQEKAPTREPVSSEGPRVHAAPEAVGPFPGLRAEELARGPESAAATEPTAPLSVVAPPASRSHTERTLSVVRTPQPEPANPELSVKAVAEAIPAPLAINDTKAPALEAAAEEALTHSPEPAKKSTEALAAERPVANTSGRSATRPAGKRPRNGEGKRKKK